MDIRSGSDVVVGRDLEIAALQAAVAAAQEGRGGVIVVSGPPGIGKSHLVAAALAGAPGVLRGRCVPDSGAPPLWPWLRVIDRLPTGFLPAEFVAAADTPDTFESASARFRFLARMCDGLARAAAVTGGLVVVVEDLHDADELSLALLRLIADEAAQSYLLVICTHRNTGTVAAGGWGATLAEMTRSLAVQTISLAPLRIKDVAAYLTARGINPAVAGELHERTGGLPLLVAATTRVLLAGDDSADTVDRLPGLPPTDLQVLVAAMLGGLDQATRDSARAAAALDEDVDPVLLAEVQDITIAAVHEHLAALTSAGVIRSTGRTPPSYRFVHQLIRDGIAGSATDAGQWHRLAARSLEDRIGTDPRHAGRIAAHWARAGDDIEAVRSTVRWTRTAAAHAMHMAAPHDAARLLDQALTALDHATPPAADRAELLIELARAEYLAGRVPSALEHLRNAAATFGPDHHPDLLASAALVIYRARDHITQIGAAALCDRALDALDRGAPTGVKESPSRVTTRARLTARKALLDIETNQLDDPDGTTVHALRLAEESGDIAALLDATQARVEALDQPQHVDERRHLAARAIQLGRAAQRTISMARGHIWLIDAAYQTVDIAAADREITKLTNLATVNDHPGARWFAHRAAATRDALTGRFDTAMSQSESAGTLASRMQDPVARAVTDQFTTLLALIRGDPHQIPPLAQAPPAIPRQPPELQAAQALRLQLLGDHSGALSVYQHLRLRLRRPGPGMPSLGVLQYLTELVEAFDDAEAAAWAHRHWLPWAATGGLPASAAYFCGGAPARAIGRMAAVQGHLDDAEHALRLATTINTQLDAQPLLTHTWLELADVLRRKGHPHELSEAVILTERAAGQARRLDQPGPLVRAEKLRTKLTCRQRGDDPLTAREREVANLILQALTNRKIAETLFLSERTVETHVHNILAKLGLANRNELIAQLLRQQKAGIRL